MVNRMIQLLGSETFRYLICGVLTVIVNTILFLFFSLWYEELIANTIAFFLSVLFAYITNTRFVFRQKLGWKTFTAFFGMRIGTIFIDNGGLMLLLFLGVNSLLAKCIVNVVVIVLNYIFSKFFIYRRK